MKTIKISFIVLLMACLSANAQWVTSGNVNTANVSTGGNVLINGNQKYIQLGVGVANKEASAGIIGYQLFAPFDALDVVGAGTINNRKLTVWAEGGTLFKGNIHVNNGNFIRLGAGANKEGGAGTIGYQLFTPDALDVVGAGTSGSNRKIKFWAEGGTLFNGGVEINGSVGIGTSCIPVDGTNVPYKLAVNGKIISNGIRVKNYNPANANSNCGWPDFVFDQGYKLKSLNEVENFIAANKRLPGIPAAKEVDAEGFDLEEMVRLQMMKIEELTLYMINLKKENEALKAQVSEIAGK